jgi:hypothetical protein
MWILTLYLSTKLARRTRSTKVRPQALLTKRLEGVEGSDLRSDCLYSSRERSVTHWIISLVVPVILLEYENPTPTV